MFTKLKKIGIANRAQDEILYECVLEEIEQGIRTKGLWAKALAYSDGIESKAEAKYMQYRVQAIKDQFDALKIAYDEMSRKSLFNYIRNGFKDTNFEVDKTVEKEEDKETTKRLEELEIQTDDSLKQINNQNTDNDLLAAFGFIVGIFLIIFIGSWIYHFITQ